MSVHLGCMWFNTPALLLAAFCSPHWQTSAFLCSQIFTVSTPAQATHLEQGQTFTFDGYQNWFKVLCKVLIQYQRVIPGMENASPVIYSGEQSVLRCGILPFRQYWLKEIWSEEAIKRIEERGTGKDCDGHLSNHYATYSTAYSISLTFRLIYTHTGSWTVK